VQLYVAQEGLLVTDLFFEDWHNNYSRVEPHFFERFFNFSGPRGTPQKKLQNLDSMYQDAEYPLPIADCWKGVPSNFTAAIYIGTVSSYNERSLLLQRKNTSVRIEAILWIQTTLNDKRSLDAFPNIIIYLCLGYSKSDVASETYLLFSEVSLITVTVNYCPFFQRSRVQQGASSLDSSALFFNASDYYFRINVVLFQISLNPFIVC
jgi:hypothetical protein